MPAEQVRTNLPAEHFSKGFEERWLGDTFSKVTRRLQHQA
jgi:hypothetical protein